MLRGFRNLRRFRNDIPRRSTPVFLVSLNVRVPRALVSVFLAKGVGTAAPRPPCCERGAVRGRLAGGKFKGDAPRPPQPPTLPPRLP
eukprot:8083222-Pyramimonas_sp.AAC.1